MADSSPNPVAPLPSGSGASRAHPLDYGARSRWEGAPTKLLDFLKTLGWVAPLTILVWIYAEREQSAVVPSISFPVEVRLPEANRVVTLIDPPEPDHNLVVMLAGPRTNVERVIREITTINGDHPRIQLTLPPKIERGERTLQTMELVTANPIFAANGISVRGVSPPTIRVNVDDLDEKDLPVQAPAGLTTVAEEPSFLPSMVKVRAPKTVFEKATRENKLRLVADLTRVDAFKQPGHHDVPSVPLTWEFQGPSVNLGALAVRTVFDVKQSEQQYTIPSLPVFLVIPSTVQDRFEVKYPTTVANVRVAGPPEMITRIKDESTPVAARLYIDPSRLITGRKLQGVLKFDRPDGVHFADEAAKQEVEYELTERSPAP